MQFQKGKSGIPLGAAAGLVQCDGNPDPRCGRHRPQTMNKPKDDETGQAGQHLVANPSITTSVAWLARGSRQDSTNARTFGELRQNASVPGLIIQAKTGKILDGAH
jgi:hypothetical protein